jgi:hypothetical protein
LKLTQLGSLFLKTFFADVAVIAYYYIDYSHNGRCKVEPSHEDKECTFAPKINMYRNRNLGEFLDLQRGFVERKEMKLARMKE